MAFKKFADIVDLSTMYYPSILLCTVLLYSLGGKQRKVRVGNDPLRHLSFDLYGVKSKILYSSLGTNWSAKTEKGKPQVCPFPRRTKSKKQPRRGSAYVTEGTKLCEMAKRGSVQKTGSWSLHGKKIKRRGTRAIFSSRVQRTSA